MQISDARRALESTLDDLTLDVADAADVRRWVRRYPWAALGTALVAGFTLGHVVSKRRRRVDTTDHDPQPSDMTEDSTAAPTPTTAKTAATGGWRTALLNALFELFRLVVTQFVAAGVRQAANRAASSQRSASSGHSSTAQPSEAQPSVVNASSDDG